MRVIAFTKRLMRDLREQDPAQMSVDMRMELLDAINSSIQRVNALSPVHTRITTASLELAPPVSVTLQVENGSNGFAGYLATDTDLYCTIRIDGDPVDNQITGAGEMLFNYDGPTGTAQATLYHDALTLPQSIAEITGVPMLLDHRTELEQDSTGEMRGSRERAVGRPRFWWVEPNAIITMPPGPAVFRVDSLPPTRTRIQAEVMTSANRITLEEMLSSEAVMPFREDTIESCLLPVTRGALAESGLWSNPETKAAASSRAESALAAYSILSSSFLATPAHRIGTPRGF
jgi:hypothetical protein